ncbi:MAG: hypothetical protein NVS3B18_00550 [Candidatus Dormibacteria bacterium]
MVLGIRWNPHEAAKPYARPFGVELDGSGGGPDGMVAVNGADLLYLRHFQVALLRLTGALYRQPEVEAAGDPQRAWLDRLAALLPSLEISAVAAGSSFDEQAGRVHHFNPVVAGCPWVAVDAAQLVEYQDFQAALAHQTGRLYREPSIEAIEEPGRRQAAWLAVVAALLGQSRSPE